MLAAGGEAGGTSPADAAVAVQVPNRGFTDTCAECSSREMAADDFVAACATMVRRTMAPRLVNGVVVRWVTVSRT